MLITATSINAQEAAQALQMAQQAGSKYPDVTVKAAEYIARSKMLKDGGKSRLNVYL